MLFSEPKIPQKRLTVLSLTMTGRFSALQRAENSSDEWDVIVADRVITLFQCSSASRKFLKFCEELVFEIGCVGFSALQRAENSSNLHRCRGKSPPGGFSALQRAENSSNVVE